MLDQTELNLNSRQLWQAARVSKMFSRKHDHGPGKGEGTSVWAAHTPDVTAFYLPAEKMDAGRSAAPDTRGGW